MIVFLILISVFRIQQLTASLMSKQNILERVTSERTSLAYRLERLEVRTGGLVTSQITSPLLRSRCPRCRVWGSAAGGARRPRARTLLTLRSVKILHVGTCSIKYAQYSLHVSVERCTPLDMISMCQDSPFDGPATRQVKKAYTEIDKLSIRIGIALRWVGEHGGGGCCQV